MQEYGDFFVIRPTHAYEQMNSNLALNPINDYQPVLELQLYYFWQITGPHFFFDSCIRFLITSTEADHFAIRLVLQ